MPSRRSTIAMFPARILVAVDDTPPARRALETAVELQHATGSELLLVHVKLLRHYVTGDAPSPAAYERAEQEGREVLDGAVEHAQQSGASVQGSFVRMGRQIDTELVRIEGEADYSPDSFRHVIERIYDGWDLKAAAR
jgi:nucleotide-binding universal stress UspA family protein